MAGGHSDGPASLQVESGQATGSCAEEVRKVAPCNTGAMASEGRTRVTLAETTPGVLN